LNPPTRLVQSWQVGTRNSSGVAGQADDAQSKLS
jgi:hypothetical protein